ncbi:MAG: aminoglycoside phosphotransferase family protein, partial [Clostridia bacterium]|nr:aminoglycoside phosphotransferase family protein [Clostridia bacterium]
SNYRAFFPRPAPGVPRCFGSVSACGDDYLLLSCERGESLLSPDRDSVRAAVDTLAGIQDLFWGDTSHSGDGITFEKSLASRTERGKYLGDEALEKCYARFLELYSRLPRTLCHDDLLPYNVLYDGERAVIVDWEYAGILPYPSSFARFIAHCREGEDELFRMRDADKEFAKAYYYERFVKEKGIDEREYRRDLDYFIFYEYCEWIMLMNKYPDSDKTRGEKYYKLAKELALRLE